MTFDSLGLKPTLLQAVIDTGYTQPTPIQAQAIPAILSGGDVMAAAQTGTGKTAGFTLPLLQRLGEGSQARANRVRALVLTPTRELAAQIQDSIETYGKHEGLRSVVVFGGVKINPQMMALRKGVDILVATPGRLLDLYQQKALTFADLEVLVLDEADRMLDMGFIRDIRRILPLLPKQRQNLMFSATFSDEIRELARSICQKPKEIDVAPRNTTVESIQQTVYKVAKEQKVNLLSHLLQETSDQTLVFSRTKHGANKLVKRLLKDGVSCAAIHGNKSQNQRTKALADFKADRIQVLVATDIAARGIDIDELALVINFDLPNVQEDYVHRIGRTGRAGASGRALSLVSPDEDKLLRDIERFIKRKVPVADTPAFDQSAGRVNLDDDDRPAQQRQSRSTPRRAASPSRQTSSGQGAEEKRAEGNDRPRRQRRSRRASGESPRSASGNTSGNNSAAASTSTGNRRSPQPRRQRSGNGERSTVSGNRQSAEGGQRASRGESARSGNRAAASTGPASESALSRLKRFFGKDAAA